MHFVQKYRLYKKWPVIIYEYLSNEEISQSINMEKVSLTT